MATTLSSRRAAEMDGSVQEFDNAVHSAFYKAFERSAAVPAPSEEDIWITDVFETYVIVRSGAKLYRVDLTQEADGTITFAPRADWVTVRQSYTEVREMADGRLEIGPDVLLVHVSEFSGKDWRTIAERIPVPQALLDSDPDAFFVTMPIATVGAESKGDNKLKYGQAANEKIVEQFNAKRPEGIWGHMRDDELNTRYDMPSVMGVGALLEDGTTWGKFYVPPYAQDTREYYKSKMALNAKAGFSLFGTAWADPVTNEVLDMDLSKIDIADPERVGLPVSAVPIISRNMRAVPETVLSDEGETHLMAEVTMQEMQANLTAAETRIAEMAGVLGVKSDGVLDALKATTQRAKLVSEMTGVLGVAEDALMTTVAEMATTISAYREQERNAQVRAVLGSALGELEPMVMVEMRKLTTWPEGETLKTAIDTVLEQPAVKKLAEMIVKAKGGPAIAFGTAGRSNSGDETNWEEEGPRLAREKGMLK